MPLRLFLLMALVATLAFPAAADAGRSSHLWSTINVCNPESQPNTVGIRARMPGNGTRERMFMRFRTQFYDQDDYAWKYVRRGGRSGWLEVGSALFLFKETGFSFTFDAPPSGQAYLFRGVVEFQWRTKRGKVKRRTRKFTAGGKRTRGADPRGFSAARCRIEGPAEPASPARKLVEPRG